MPISLNQLNSDARQRLLLQAQVQLARHYAALVKTGKPENQKYILDWGKVLFPEKFYLPFCHEMHDYFCQERDTPFTADEAPRGHAKCVHPSTRVFCVDGIKTADSVKAGDKVYAIDDRNKIVQRRVEAIQGGQFKSGWILHTRTGRKIQVSDEHRLFTSEGYHKIEDIYPGNYVGVLNSEIESPNEINDDELKFFAYMLFEGYCGTAGSKKVCHKVFTSASEALTADFRASLQAVGLWENKSFSPIEVRVTSKSRQILEKFGINNQSCKAKRLPAFFFSLSLRQKYLFFRIMFDTDGFVAKKAGNIGITLANEGLIEDIQLLLSSCGIVASKNYRQSKCNNKIFPAWMLTINGSYAKKLIEKCGFLEKKNNFESLLSKPRYSLFDIFPNKIKRAVVNIERLAREKNIRVDNRYEITRGKLERLSSAFPECDEFKKQLEQGIFWDKVESIERVEAVEEYIDLQISGNENFIADGIISHNTTVKCFLIPIFQALEEPWKYQHYLNVQATEDKALSINSSIMCEIEENLTLRAMYGNQQTTRKWTNSQFVLKNGVVFSAIGAGQSIRGINYQQIRPDYILVDDLYNDDDIHNTESTIKKNNWFWGALYPARAKGKRNAIKIQGTAINEDDLLNKAKTSKRIKARTFKAITDWDKKVVLWPEHNTFASLMDDREDMGSLIFYREYQNDRLDDSTSKIKRSWLADWEDDPDTLIFDRFKLLTTVILGNDPSIGKKVENDFAAFCVVFRWRSSDSNKQNFYVDFVTQDKLSLDERIKKLLYIFSQYQGIRKIRQVRIEAISGFQDYTSEVKRRTTLPVKEITWVKDKVAILENKSKYFEFGQVKINKNIPPPMKDTLIYQLTCNHPNHDDLRDALFLCLDDTKDWRDWV